MDDAALSDYHQDLVDLFRRLYAEVGSPTIREIARRCSAATGTVSEALSGKTLPSPEIAGALAVALGAEPAEVKAARWYAERARRPRRSGPLLFPYLKQVELIAPSELIGRDGELEELAEFCRGVGDADYVWWQAPPWAGKSALMSWFVLNPPAKVRIVSFFVTARIPGQNTRATFVEAVMEQLAAIVGRPAPRDLTPATREPQLLTLLDEAARRCRDRRGERLVLLVDGLDEEEGSDGHSIAGVLPARPPFGLRVVVAGRPHPPIPGYLPAHHPLHDHSVVRHLAPVPAAKAVKEDAAHDLERVLTGDDTGQQILGVITAAGAGLTADDLADLVRVVPWLVDRHLRTHRIYQRSVRDGYQLAHQELDTGAANSLGRRCLDEHRARLREWANRYRDAGWPEETPAYLLHEYVPKLLAIGDLDAVVDLTTDRTRYDRILAATGGDAVALRDLDSALQYAVARSDPGAACLIRLHQLRLIARNAHIPPGLAALWAALGHPDRAAALAHGLPEDARREARIEIGAALVGAGALPTAEAWHSTTPDAERHDLLQRMAETALTAEAQAAVERLAAASPKPSVVLYRLARTAAERGDFAGAEALRDRHSLKIPYTLGQALAAAGHIDAAEAMAGSISDRWARSEVLQAVARAIAGTGDADRAARIAESMPSEHRKQATLLTVVRRLAATGHLDAALTLGRNLDPELQPLIVIHIVNGRLVQAAATDPGSILDMAEQIAAEYPRLAILAQTGELLAPDSPVGEKAAKQLGMISDSGWLDALFARLANEVARNGTYADAMRVALLVPSSEERAKAIDVVARIRPKAAARDAANHTPQTLVAVARQLAAAGLTTTATRLAENVEADARRRQDDAAGRPRPRPERRHHGRVTPDAAPPNALVGDPDAMAAHIRSINDFHTQVSTLLAAIDAMRAAGDTETLQRFAHQVVGHYDESESGPATVDALIALGAIDRAEAFARQIQSVDSLQAVAEAQAERGSLEHAEKLARELGSADVYGIVATNAANRGDLPRARRLLAHAIAGSGWQDWLPILKILDPPAAHRIHKHTAT